MWILFKSFASPYMKSRKVQKLEVARFSLPLYHFRFLHVSWQRDQRLQSECGSNPGSVKLTLYPWVSCLASSSLCFFVWVDYSLGSCQVGLSWGLNELMHKDTYGAVHRKHMRSRSQRHYPLHPLRLPYLSNLLSLFRIPGGDLLQDTLCPAGAATAPEHFAYACSFPSLLLSTLQSVVPMFYPFLPLLLLLSSENL